MFWGIWCSCFFLQRNGGGSTQTSFQMRHTTHIRKSKMLKNIIFCEILFSLTQLCGEESYTKKLQIWTHRRNTCSIFLKHRTSFTQSSSFYKVSITTYFFFFFFIRRWYKSFWGIQPILTFCFNKFIIIISVDMIFLLLTKEKLDVFTTSLLLNG